MIPRPKLAYATDDPDARLMAFVALLEEKGVIAKPSPPKRYRHAMLNLDFWFMFMANICVLLVFTSFIPTKAFEPLLTAAFLCGMFAMMLNLTRTQQELPPKPEPSARAIGGFWRVWQERAGINIRP